MRQERSEKLLQKVALNEEIESYKDVNFPIEKPKKRDVLIKDGKSKTDEAVKIIINFFKLIIKLIIKWILIDLV
jgi:adenylylsulfate kinase-like enzyme